MTSSAEIRDRMRRDWGARRHEYATAAAQINAAVADLLLGLVAPDPGDRVLDVATGPGVVALRAARLTGPTGPVLATDIAPEWEEFVTGPSAAEGLPNVSFRAMGAEALDLPGASFDVAYCQFGLMFVPDRARALGELRRVLRPGGRLGIAVWSTADRVPLFAPARMVAEVVPPSPDDANLPGPLALGEPGLIERLVAEAGFEHVAVERRIVERVVDDPDAYWQQMLNRNDGQLAAALASRPADADHLHRRIVDFLEQHRDNNEIRLPSEVILVGAMR
ncbi:MAG: class I SAM-dependent methyltransferase [Thermomicrobiales bacterium]